MIFYEFSIFIHFVTCLIAFLYIDAGDRTQDPALYHHLFIKPGLLVKEISFIWCVLYIL